MPEIQTVHFTDGRFLTEAEVIGLERKGGGLLEKANSLTGRLKFVSSIAIRDRPVFLLINSHNADDITAVAVYF